MLSKVDEDEDDYNDNNHANNNDDGNDDHENNNDDGNDDHDNNNDDGSDDDDDIDVDNDDNDEDNDDDSGNDIDHDNGDVVIVVFRCIPDSAHPFWLHRCSSQHSSHIIYPGVCLFLPSATSVFVKLYAPAHICEIGWTNSDTVRGVRAIKGLLVQILPKAPTLAQRSAMS